MADKGLNTFYSMPPAKKKVGKNRKSSENTTPPCSPYLQSIAPASTSIIMATYLCKYT
jgi:hypothetical protein